MQTTSDTPPRTLFAGADPPVPGVWSHPVRLEWVVAVD